MKETQGLTKTIRELLSGKKYGVDFFQREYKWEQKQIEELIQDLTAKFTSFYSAEDTPQNVSSYGHYFLGPIIVSQSQHDEKLLIIDGQQRLTSITLVLIWLYRNIEDPDHKGQLANLINSQSYGVRSYNLDFPEDPDRIECMEALYSGKDIEGNGKSPSTRNILARYDDIKQLLSDAITPHAIPLFAYWLAEKVQLVEIRAAEAEDAYTIFETMNDRGMPLTPADMLKGYLLAKTEDEYLRSKSSKVWKSCVEELNTFGKDEDAACIKAWLRSQYANSTRERKANAEPRDFDRIGTEFHRWVKENEPALGLIGSQKYADFIQTDMMYYTKAYVRMRSVATQLTHSLEPIFYNALQKYTLQYPLLLAPLLPTDNEKTSDAKMRVVATYIDILITRRIWSFRSIDYSTMQYAMFNVMKDIRRHSAGECADLLAKRLGDEPDFGEGEPFRLHGTNRRAIKYILARITDYVETQSGGTSRFTEYVAEGKNRYEIEHIWADHYERHAQEFSQKSDFDVQRNRIGGLLLLPKTFNASYGDLSYEEKLEQYFGQNMLAKSLHSRCYTNHPGFSRFIVDRNLAFRPLPIFLSCDLEERQKLYLQLAKLIWNPSRLQEAVT